MDAHGPVKAEERDRYPLVLPNYERLNMTLKQVIELLQWSKELLGLHLSSTDHSTINGMYGPRMGTQYDEAIDELKRFMENTDDTIN